MNVELLVYTPDPEKIVAIAAKLCYSDSTIKEVEEKFYNEEERKRLINLLLEKNHLSPFEHITFTFGIEGISRACSHQLVRHRIASYSMQSQRYVKFKNEVGYIIPISIGNSTLLEEYKKYILEGQKLYEKMIENKIKPEDARYIFHNAITTNIIATFNARSLFNFFELRCCFHAQREIWLLANKMLSLVKKVAPNVFSKAGRTCFNYGYCRENDNKCSNYKYIINKN